MNDSPLSVPRASLEALPYGIHEYDSFAHLEEVARAVAAPIVAAELRRLADELDVVRAEMREVDDRSIRSSGLGEGISRLRARADELEREAS